MTSQHQQQQQQRSCEQRQEQQEGALATVQMSLLDLAPLICPHMTNTARNQQPSPPPLSLFGRQDHHEKLNSRQRLNDIIAEALDILDDDDFLFSD